METKERLNPATDIGSGRPGSGECDMLILLHEFLLSDVVSARYIHLYRVSHLKVRFMELFSPWVKGFMGQFLSAAVVRGWYCELFEPFSDSLERSRRTLAGILCCICDAEGCNCDTLVYFLIYAHIVEMLSVEERPGVK